MTRLELLERVNRLNMNQNSYDTFWTCTVMYNTVIWRAPKGERTKAVMFQTIPGVPE